MFAPSHVRAPPNSLSRNGECHSDKENWRPASPQRQARTSAAVFRHGAARPCLALRARGMLNRMAFAAEPVSGRILSGLPPLVWLRANSL